MITCTDLCLGSLTYSNLPPCYLNTCFCVAQYLCLCKGHYSSYKIPIGPQYVRSQYYHYSLANLSSCKQAVLILATYQSALVLQPTIKRYTGVRSGILQTTSLLLTLLERS